MAHAPLIHCRVILLPENQTFFFSQAAASLYSTRGHSVDIAFISFRTSFWNAFRRKRRRGNIYFLVSFKRKGKGIGMWVVASVQAAFGTHPLLFLHGDSSVDRSPLRLLLRTQRRGTFGITAKRDIYFCIGPHWAQQFVWTTFASCCTALSHLEKCIPQNLGHASCSI